MRLGIDLSLAGPRSSGTSYSAEATAYFAAMSVQPDSTRKGLLNTLITSLKTAGVWAKLDWLNIAAAHDEQAARINAKNPAQVATAVNTPTFTTDRGFTGNGTNQYLNTGVNPSTAGGQYTQNSCHSGVWCGTDVTGVLADIGNNSATLVARSGLNINYTPQSGTNSNTALLVATSVGHSCWSRTGASVGGVYKNGVNLAAIASASSAPTNGNVFIMAYNNTTTGGTTPAAYSTRRHQAGHFGSGLTDADDLALYNALATYMTAVGA